MHHKILKHLLSLFFVIILLTILGLQWAVKENSQLTKEAVKQETENYKLIIPRYPESPEKIHQEAKIY
ncbi:MAG: hypothetical protein J0M37_04205 [Ignavibacteria bacterium]|nr:hypothetical protein [Ignavibacteria bacterium]